MIYKIALALVVLLVAYMFYKNNTTPSYLGVTNGQFAPMPSSPNAVSSQTDIEEKKVSPLSYAELEDAKKKVKKVLAQLPSNTVVTENEQYMHIVFTTETMKYKDDVELYFNPELNIIEYRSQSRVGYSDRGLNMERYTLFSDLYNGLK